VDGVFKSTKNLSNTSTEIIIARIIYVQFPKIKSELLFKASVFRNNLLIQSGIDRIC